MTIRASGTFDQQAFIDLVGRLKSHVDSGGTQLLFDRRDVSEAIDFEKLEPFADAIAVAVEGRGIAIAVLAPADASDHKIGLAIAFSKGVTIAGFVEEHEAKHWLERTDK